MTKKTMTPEEVLLKAATGIETLDACDYPFDQFSLRRTVARVVGIAGWLDGLPKDEGHAVLRAAEALLQQYVEQEDLDEWSVGPDMTPEKVVEIMRAAARHE
jgi:hypothetical protein